MKLTDYHKATGGQTDPSLSRWLDTLPQRTRRKLVQIGLLSRERVAVAKSLTEHLDDFAAALRGKGNSKFHVQVVTTRARRIITACAFRYYSDISASKIMGYLDNLRQDTPTQRGISAQTFNFYLQAIKQFCRWMVNDRRAHESPVTHLGGLNVKLDRRRDRRALKVDELRRLVETTERGPERNGMSGSERALLYRLALETGLRAGELRSLTRSSFDLNPRAAMVTVEAAYSKHRRTDTLPLRPDLAQALGFHLADVTPAVTAFRMPKCRKVTAEMFRADLEAAGIVYRDDGGLVADFHSLRHTFISNLAAGGVHPKVAQSLARHSTITLTMDRYTHTCIGEQADALTVLPDLTQPSCQTVRATGTCDVDGTRTVLADCLALQGRFVATPMGADGHSEAPTIERIDTGFPVKNLKFLGQIN